MKHTLLDILSGIGAMLLTFVILATPIYATYRVVTHSDWQCWGGILWGGFIVGGLFLALINGKDCD